MKKLIDANRLRDLFYYGIGDKPILSTADEDAMVIQIINDQPAIEVPRWISVNEQLPPLKKHVLLACYGRVVYGRLEDPTGNDGYPIFRICDNVSENRPVVKETTEHSIFTKGRITAWMALPACEE